MDNDESEQICNGTHRRQKERTPAAIEAQVLRLHRGSSIDQLAEALCASDWLLSRAKGIDILIKQIAVGWIEENGPFTVGDIQYSVGYHSSNKCCNVHQTGHRVLEVVGGDIDQLLATLCSQPYKAAAVRTLLEPRVFGSLFKHVRIGKLVNGVPERVLKRTDQRFVEPRTSRD